MKVLYVVNSLTRDVAAGFKQDEHVQRAFAKLGWEVILHSPACAPGTQKDAARLHRRAYQAARRILPTRLSSAMRLRYTLHHDEMSVQTVRRLMEVHQPDLLFERYASLQEASVRVARSMSVPSIVQFHAPPEESPHYRASARAARLLESRMLETAAMATVVAVVTDALAEYFIARGVPEDKIVVLPNAIDVDRFQRAGSAASVRASIGIGPARCIVGYVGTMKPWHDCDILPDVFARVKRAAPATGFLIVGPFPHRTYHKTFTMRLVKHGIRDDCYLTGPVQSDLVPGYIQAMDICVMPDTTDYCSPMKLFEYGACGKVVVMPRRRPIEGVVSHGRNGLLFEPGSPADMADKIISVTNGAVRRESLGAQLQQDISSRPTYVDNVERILECAQLNQCLDL